MLKWGGAFTPVWGGRNHFLADDDPTRLGRSRCPLAPRPGCVVYYSFPPTFPPKDQVPYR